MNLIVVDNYEELSKVAAKEFAKVINEKPNAVLGLATGGSPVGMYKELIKMYENKELDLELECKEYDKKIEELGGIDIQLLGVGNNGHIAFNEPDEELSSGTHIITLTEDTIKANARFFANEADVPRRAISMGVGGIMKSKKIVLIASGESKAEAIKGLFSGKITTDNPASMLQMHRDVTVVVDKAAATLINE